MIRANRPKRQALVVPLHHVAAVVRKSRRRVLGRRADEPLLVAAVRQAEAERGGVRRAEIQEASRLPIPAEKGADAVGLRVETPVGQAAGHPSKVPALAVRGL